MASRLSYFLWSTTPDDELLRLAEQGRLQDPKVLAAQVERMLDDPRSRTFVDDLRRPVAGHAGCRRPRGARC